MPANDTLTPATELVKCNGARFPGESSEYRKARDALLAEEIELRRHIERVARMRRELPPGHEVTKRYGFEGEEGRGEQGLAHRSRHAGAAARRKLRRPLVLGGQGSARAADQGRSLA